MLLTENGHMVQLPEALDAACHDVVGICPSYSHAAVVK